MHDMPLKDTEAAKLVGVKVQTLRNYRHLGKGPAYVKIGHSVRYLPEDLRDFLLSNRIDPAKIEQRFKNGRLRKREEQGGEL